MRWKKLDYYYYEQQLRELGCPEPSSPSHYSYCVKNVGFIREQPCVDLFTSIKPKAHKKYKIVQHYSIDTACKEATHVLCRREHHSLRKSTVTMHPIGECPLSYYHTEEEFYKQCVGRHGTFFADTVRKARETRQLNLPDWRDRRST